MEYFVSKEEGKKNAVNSQLSQMAGKLFASINRKFQIIPHSANFDGKIRNNCTKWKIVIQQEKNNFNNKRKKKKAK